MLLPLLLNNLLGEAEEPPVEPPVVEEEPRRGGGGRRYYARSQWTDEDREGLKEYIAAALAKGKPVAKVIKAAEKIAPAVSREAIEAIVKAMRPAPRPLVEPAELDTYVQ